MPKKEPEAPQRTQIRQKFLDNLAMGMTDVQAAKAAGSADPKQYAEAQRQNPLVRAKIDEIRQMFREEIAMTREKVQKIVVEAVDMARTLADPSTMIKGAQELNRMCGFYAPEKREIELTGKAEGLKREYELMSETELLRAIGQEPDAIEGEFERLNRAELEHHEDV